MSLVLDAGAVSAIAEGDPRARAFVTRMRAEGHLVLTPAVVVAEVTGRGARDATTNRALDTSTIVDVGEALARLAGVLRVRSGVTGTVDALVVATAATFGEAVVLSADLADIGRLAGEAVGVEVHRW